MSHRFPNLAARSFLTAFFTTVALQGCDGKSAEEFEKSGRAYLDKRDYPAAVIQFKSALQKSPDNAEARFLLGTALRELGDSAGAAIELRKAAAGGHGASDVYPQLLLALLERGKFDEVLSEGEKAKVEDKGAQSAILSLMGEALVYSGKADAAQKKLQDALSLDPVNQRAKLVLSKLALSRGDLTEANKLVDALMANSAPDDAVFFQKAVLVQATGNSAEAVRLYKRAIELRPRNAQAYFSLIWLELERGDIQAASDHVAALRQVAGGSPTALYLEALVAYRKSDKTRAWDAIRDVLKSAPDYAPANTLAGALAFEAGNYGEAEQYLLKALSTQPGALYPRRLLVAMYARGGQIEKAKESLGRLLKEGTADPVTLLVAGEVYAAAGDAQKAADYFEKASSVDPKNSAARTRLGQMYLATGATQRAIESLGAAALDPTRYEADVALVSYYLSRKQLDNALQAAEALRKKQPENPVTYHLFGLVQLAKSDRAAARVSFERALQAQRSFLPAARNLATLDVQEGKPEIAMKRFEAVTMADPKQDEAWLALAALKQQTDAPSAEVLPLIDHAISASPGSTRAKLAKINYLVKTGAAKKAVAAALEAQTVHPSDASILDALAGAQLKAGEVDQAVTSYGKLTALMPKSAGPYLGIASAHVARKDWAAARDALRRATEIQPEWLPAREAQVLLGMSSQHYEDAMASARSIQKGWPKLTVGYIAEADIHAAQARWAEAESVLKEANRRLDNAALAAKLYAVMEKRGKAAEADAMAMGWSSKHPTDPTLAAAIGQGYLVRQDFQNAARWYRVAAKAQPKSAVLLNNLAWCLGQIKDPTAIEIGKQALAIAPQSIAIMDTVAMLYVQAGEPAKGAELLGRAVAVSPRSAAIRLNYAKTLIAAGKKSDARKELELIPTLHTNQAVKDEASKLLTSL